MTRSLLLFLLLLPNLAFAAPFLVCDPDPSGAADKVFYQDGAAAAVSTSTVAGACKIDLASFSPGTHNLQVWFASTLWGVTSVKTPFVLIKPTASGIGPSNLQLAP